MRLVIRHSHFRVYWKLLLNVGLVQFIGQSGSAYKLSLSNIGLI